MCESSISKDTPLLYDDSPASASEVLPVHNALSHIRSQNWSSAFQDANKVMSDYLFHIPTLIYPHIGSIGVRPSTMGYVAEALAQIGMGEPEKAIQTFDLVFWNSSTNDLLLLLKVCEQDA